MESFSADWLALREPVDHAVRSEALTAGVAGAQHGRHGLRAVDLAGGTGSNVRYLLPRLPAVTRWTLLDHDPRLLEQATRLTAADARAAGATFDTGAVDLRDVAVVPLDGVALVTAAALLDLVSEPWLRAFARRCREARVDVLCALSYDGRIVCDPAEVDDRLVRDLVNRHQRTDKGFGVALGPDAARVAADCFRDEGFAVQTAESDWVLDGRHAELQRQLLEGWAGAARTMSPPDAASVDAWLARRLAQLASGGLGVRVGHTDLVATIR